MAEKTPQRFYVHDTKVRGGIVRNYRHIVIDNDARRQPVWCTCRTAMRARRIAKLLNESEEPTRG